MPACISACRRDLAKSATRYLTHATTWRIPCDVIIRQSTLRSSCFEGINRRLQLLMTCATKREHSPVENFEAITERMATRWKCYICVHPILVNSSSNTLPYGIDQGVPISLFPRAKNSFPVGPKGQETPFWHCF
jgi:hypothetical protein